VITQDNDLNEAWILDAGESWDMFLTEIDAGVSELCWADVEVTRDVCSVVCFSNAKFQWIADITVAVIDEDTWCACL